MRKKSNLSLNKPKRQWRTFAKERKNYLSSLKSPLVSPTVTSYGIQNCQSPRTCRNSIKRKLTKSPFTPKFAFSRARYLSSPLAKRGKGDAARVLFENAAQDKSTVTEEDEFRPLGGMIDIIGNEEKQSLTQELIKLAPTVFP